MLDIGFPLLINTRVIGVNILGCQCLHRQKGKRNMMRAFKTPEKRAAFYRALMFRTDRKARGNRMLRELDQRRIEAGPLGAMSAARPLPSQPMHQQAER